MEEQRDEKREKREGQNIHVINQIYSTADKIYI